jgi:hypothetical protein
VASSRNRRVRHAVDTCPGGRCRGAPPSEEKIHCMTIESLTKFWPLILSVIQEFWAITEPHIEEAAIQSNIPIELYYYSELGLDSFSTGEFQKRDPFSNPMQFEKMFVTLNFKGWIEPLPDEKYKVTDKARDAARRMIQEGDSYLLPFESFTDLDLKRLYLLLKQIVQSNTFAPEPPRKWAVEKRFRVADNHSPLIVQIREYLMDLFAYRDDSHISASHPHFGQAGIVWSVLGSLWRKDTVTAEQLAQSMPFRAYEVNDYEVALQAAVQIGWAEWAEGMETYRITEKGRALREQVEQLTNEYFYSPWSVMTNSELDELYELLLKLREQLNSFRKVR